MSEKWKDRASKETMQMFEGKHGLQDGRCMEIAAEKLIRTLHTADTEELFYGREKTYLWSLQGKRPQKDT